MAKRLHEYVKEMHPSLRKYLLYSKNGFCLECVILWLVSGIHRINNAKVRVEAFSLPSIDIKLEKMFPPSIP